MENDYENEWLENCLAALKDPEAEVRFAAVMELGRLGDRRAVEPLAAILQDKNEIEWLRSCAASALGKLSFDDVVAPLVNALQDKRFPVVRAAIEALGSVKSVNSVQPLAVILGDKTKRDLHAVTVTMLGRIGGEGISGLLLGYWSSFNTGAKVRAAFALGEAGVPEAVPLLIEALGDRHVRLRATAASWLGSMNDVLAVLPLTQCLKDSSEPVRCIAASSLGYLCDKTAVPFLEVALDDPKKRVRREAAKALRRIKS